MYWPGPIGETRTVERRALGSLLTQLKSASVVITIATADKARMVAPLSSQLEAQLSIERTSP